MFKTCAQPVSIYLSSAVCRESIAGVLTAIFIASLNRLFIFKYDYQHLDKKKIVTLENAIIQLEAVLVNYLHISHNDRSEISAINCNLIKMPFGF